MDATFKVPSAPRVVIIGAGFGGLYAARALRRAPVSLTMVDQRNYHLFQPLLYQVATAGLSPGDIAYPIRSIVRNQKNTEVLLAEVAAVDVAARKVILTDGELTYDFLIVAAGASHSYFGHDDWESHAPGLKTLDDALEIRRRILLAFEHAEREADLQRRRTLLTFVVVGGGPTGVELAGAIAEIARQVMVEDFRAIDPRESRILLIEAGPRILPTFPGDLSNSAEEQLKRLGVEVIKNCAVKSIAANEVIAGNETIRASAIIWAAGVTVSPLLRTLGVAVDRQGRVIVEPDLTIPSHPEVFVIGDVAVFLHQTGKPLPGVAPVAIQQGRYAARCIEQAARAWAHSRTQPGAAQATPPLRRGAPSSPPHEPPGSAAANLPRDLIDHQPPATQPPLAPIPRPPCKPFHYRDKGSLATIGRAAAVADFGRIHLSGALAWLVWVFVHILTLIGFRNRFVVTFEWAWAYVTFEKVARLITGRLDNGRAASAPK